MFPSTSTLRYRHRIQQWFISHKLPEFVGHGAQLSQPDGAGLDTPGFNPVMAERIVGEVGFSR